MEKRLYSNSSVLFSRENLLRPGNYEAHGTLGIVLTPFTWGSAQTHLLPVLQLV